VVGYNNFKKKLASGRPVLGVQLRSRSTMIAELYAMCGFDFIFIENEHFTYNMETISTVIQVCDGAGIDSVVRIPKNDQGTILQLLDTGASGLFIPHVDTVNDANAVVEAGKYPPIGDRGFSDGARSAMYGMFDGATYFENSNRDTALVPFIESKSGVENLEAIMKSGIDAVHIGPGDLAKSYGIPTGSPECEEIIKHIIAVGKKLNIPVGMPARNMEKTFYWIEQGCSFISLSSDLNIIQDVCLGFVREFNEKYPL